MTIAQNIIKYGLTQFFSKSYALYTLWNGNFQLSVAYLGQLSTKNKKKTIGQLDPKSHPLNSELEWNFCAGYLWEFALDPVVVIFFKRCQKNYKCWIKCISKNDWISQHLQFVYLIENPEIC